jgi:hypothetical protein
MTEPSVRVELRHACAICGKPAALPVEGGMQLSIVDSKGHVVGWAVHPACLQEVLVPTIRSAFNQALAG